MPFLNRHEELWQLFRVNAKNLGVIANHEEDIINFRLLDLLFCVQVSDVALWFVAHMCDVNVLTICCVVFSSPLTVLWLGQDDAGQGVPGQAEGGGGD